MKTLLIALTLVLSQAAQATYLPSNAKKYQFSFPFKNEVLRIEKHSDTYEKAFAAAAQDCFNHFKAGKKLSEDQGLDIIDVCANPRS